MAWHDQDQLLVKEHVGLFKAANNYDVYDLGGDEVLQCREPNLGGFTKLLRFSDYKRMTPFDVYVATPGGETVVQVTRGVSLVRSEVSVFDGEGVRIGGFRQKLFSIGGAFTVLDDQDQPVCELKGKWTGWDFRFMTGETELAHVTKKWAGLGKELFTSADNYVLDIAPSVPREGTLRKLILAAVMCIDMVLKE